MTDSDTTGKALLEHWTWAGGRGLMNKNTAAGLRAACSQVLSVLEDGEAVDIKTLDIDQALTRFQNLKKKDFLPAVLETYKRRFRLAVASYLAYLNDPGGWKPENRERSTEKANGKGKGSTPAPEVRPVPHEKQNTNMVEYPYPIREGQIARFILPRDLKTSEVKRVSAFLATLTVD